MFSIRRKGIRRSGNVAGKKARLTGGRLLFRLAYRVARPLGPGIVAAYFLDRTAGGERRKQALSRLGAVSRARGKKTP